MKVGLEPLATTHLGLDRYFRRGSVELLVRSFQEALANQCQTLLIQHQSLSLKDRIYLDA